MSVWRDAMNIWRPGDPWLVARGTILFVDDEPTNRELFELTLGREFDICCAAGGEEALEIIGQRPIAVIVSDQRMPVMRGIDLLERVARLSPGTQRILVTAYGDHDTAIAAINRANVFRYLTKPWRIEEMRLALTQCLAAAHLQSALSWVRDEGERRDRQAALAAANANVLQDLASLHLALDRCLDGMERLLPSLTVSLRGDILEKFEQELRDFRLVSAQIASLHVASRSEQVMPPAQPQSCNLAELLATVVELVRAGKSPGVQFTVTCSHDLSCWADRLDVARVLVNLLTNAVEAIDESGRRTGKVELVVDRDGPMVRIRISDDGPGVPADLRPKIFRPGVTTRQGGLGMGLATSIQLAAANGGTLDLEREGPGPGASFIVWLPAEAPGTRA